MSAPAIHISLALESAPRIYTQCATESDELRLAHWLDSQPQLAELVQRALELAEELRGN